MTDIKSFFHSWCNKNGKLPFFDIRLTGTKHKQRFLCELRVEGFPYLGCGNSTTKKNAQFNAARDFVQYLIREKVIGASDVPIESLSGNGSNKESNQGCSQSNAPAQRKSVFQPGMQPDIMGEAYRPYNEGQVDSTYTYIDRIAEQRNLRDAEEFDMNAAIHGNWTIENGKSRLHQFLQKNNIKAEYKYSQIGSDECRSFVAEMTIYIRALNRTLIGRESASNKASASKSCALSLVRQLYHLGMIEAFSGTLKKNKDKDLELKPYSVAISPELENRINDVLENLKIKPAPIPCNNTSEQGVSILSSTVLDEFISSKPAMAGVVSWAPPVENWNAWTSCNIDEGPLADAKLDDISQILYENLKQQLQENPKLQQIIFERQELPVYAKKNEILQTINDNPVTIIRGNTGCGKTTQVCQFILDDFIQCGQGAYCNIVVTQPRRISAVSLSDRIAFERAEMLGNSVGYNVRFESCLPRPYGGILFCTVGVLLKRLENGLRGVSHVIVDEIHERDVNTDFILVILRDMVHTYPDLRLILMSATIDTTLFCDYFGNCPIVEIPGRTYPVREYFLEDCVEMLNFVPSSYPSKKRKLKEKTKAEDDEDDEDDEEDANVCQGEDEDDDCNAIVSDSYKIETRLAMRKMNEKETNFELIEALLKHIKDLGTPGAVLIFLPGWNLIAALMKHLQNNPSFGNPQYVFLPLHSQLPKEEQKKVFTVYPENVKKVILATNIAETSITINDVVFVIDSSKAKTKIFTTHNNLTHYATVWAAKTNLEQRKGRAGRVRPGICFHLCSRARYNRLDEHMIPEILRTPLHELALAIKMLRLGSVGQFLSKAVQPPAIDAVIEAEVLLRELKCLDANDEITPLGRILGRLPIEPRLGKMIVLGCLFYCGDALVTVAASASTFTEVFAQPFERKRLTFKQKSFSGSRFSDHVAMLHAYQKWEEKTNLGPAAEENFCKSRMLSLPMLKLTREAKNQLVQLMTGISGFPEETMMPNNFDYIGPDPKLDLIVALLSMGLYPNVAYHQSKRRVLTTGNKIALIHRSSVNCTNLNQKFPVPFFVYGEKIRTKAISCKQMTMVTPIHLLLFGARKIDYVNNVIKLDGWLALDMKPQIASAIVALRPALESLIVKASRDPSYINEPSETDRKVMGVIQELCKLNAGRYGMEPLESKGFQTTMQDNFERHSGLPPLKRARFFNNRGYYQPSFGGGFRPQVDGFKNAYDNNRGTGKHFRGRFRGHWKRGSGRYYNYV